METSKMKMVYVITQRNNKNYWNRIGVAFVNNDGSLNVRLEALPVSGELQIRDYVPREEGVGYGLGRERAAAGNGANDLLAELA
jgi:hypothetical protein